MIHIKKFLEDVQTAKKLNQRNINISTIDAEKLSHDIGLFLADYAEMSKQLKELEKQNTVSVEMNGGEW